MRYSVCKRDTRSNVKYLIREENKRFGENLQVVIEIKSKTFASKTICEV